KALQQEIQAMKAASAKEIADIRDQATAQVKESVVGGDIPNSFRMPNSETSVRIYGYAEANLIKDFKATAPGDTFTNLPEQPLKKEGKPEGKTAMTAQTTRFGFETSTPTAVGPIHTQVEGDFYAYCGGECNRDRLRVRLAYGEYAGWMVGKNWSTFMDLDDGPETADFNGPIGMPFSRPVQIRYTYNLPNGASFKAALENPSDGAQRPNLVLVASKTYDWGGMNARVISHEQRMGDISKAGSGFGLGGQFKFSSELTLMGQYAEVDGDADNAIMYGANYPTLNAAGTEVLLDKSRGYVVGLTNIFSEQLRATFAYGHVESKWDAIDAYASLAGGNKKLDQWHLNFIYTPIKNVDLGAELIGGTRTTYDGDKGDLSRVNLMARYSFN
ncbi:MAG: DcaP family trimeric outer membrane transporter, partial [Comamonadaceae bacterium]